MLLLSLVAAAETVRFRTQAPASVRVGEPFQVQYSINAQVSQINPPNWGNFRLLAGPFSSYSQSTTVINGRATRQSEQTETYTLEATQPGTYTIPGATTSLNGRTYKSNSVRITVGKGGQTSGTSQTSRASQTSQTSRNIPRGKVSDKDLFVRAVLSKTQVYEQECVLLSYRLYYTVNINRLRAVKVPDWNNFGKQEVSNPDQTHHLETVNGRRYETVNLYQVILYPTKAGDYSIGPADFEAEVQVETGVDPQNIFAGFLDTYDNVVVQLHADGCSLHALPLPKQGRPSSFKGAVGQFILGSKISSQHVRANEPVTLTLTVSGQGNLKMISSPTLSMPPEFEVYDPKVNQKIQVTTNGVGGQKTIEYMLIPREEGNYTIPAVEFSYFNPQTQTFQTLQSPSYDLQVDKGDASTASQHNYSNGQKQAEDIRYICMDPIRTRAASRLLLSRPGFWLLYLLPLLAVLGLLAWLYRPVTREEKHRREVQKQVRQHLRNAERYLKADDADHYLEEMQRATKYLLEEAQSEAEKADYQAVLDQCQQARYAPNQDLKSMMTRIETLMKTTAVVFALMLTGNLQAGNLIEQGNQNYAKGDYAGAITFYEKALAEEGEAAALYCNLGDAYYKHNQLGQAVLNYERALVVNPRYGDARYNLRFVRQQVVDDTGANYVFFLRAWWNNIERLQTPNGWAWTSILSFWFLLPLLILFLLGQQVWQRKTGFYLGLVMLLVSSVSAYYAWQLTQEQANQERIVITQTLANVKPNPTNAGKNLFVVHEGTEALIVAQSGEWLRVEFGNESQGWIRKQDAETIVK